MSNTILIGLGSRARIGKDYAAAELAKYFNVERIAFADRLKSDLAAMFATNGLDFYALEKNPETKVHLRPLLVEYGMTMRAFNENHWIDIALTNREFNADITLVTDVRFPNEAKRIKELGGYYVEIKADKEPANATEAYFSPIMMSLADEIIENDFSGNYIENLLNLVQKLQTVSTRLCRKIQSEQSKVIPSTDESINSSTPDLELSSLRKS